nr:hypothetical protein [Pseudomonas cichorii]
MKFVRVLEGIVSRSISGFTFQASRVVEEGVSGSVAAIERPRFWKLLDHEEAGDALIMTKLVRLNVWLLAAFGHLKMGRKRPKAVIKCLRNLGAIHWIRQLLTACCLIAENVVWAKLTGRAPLPPMSIF